MNVPAIRNPLHRRLHLLWIVPYLGVYGPLCILWVGLRELVPEILSSLADVWHGRR